MTVVSSVARFVMPKFCDAKIKRVASYRAMDHWDPETKTITPGVETSIWRTCGRKPGHKGEHGGYGRFGRIRRLRLGLANRLDP